MEAAAAKLEKEIAFVKEMIERQRARDAGGLTSPPSGRAGG